VELHDLMVLGNVLTDLFHPVVEALRSLLRTFEGWVGSWGLAIIMLTILVRLCLLPLTVKQYRSAQAMQALQPKIKELQRKFKKDRQKLQQETMKLYQEHRVNPFASCLPILLQMPVFICLYYAIRGTQELRMAGFLWIPPGEIVSKSPEVIKYGLGNPDPYYILFVLYIVSQMISTELMMTPETEKQQKMIMRAMPLVFVVILYRFPSGLFVYWVTTNLWTIGQQLIIRRTVPKPKLQPAGARRESRLMKALAGAQDRQKQRVSGSRGDAADVEAPADEAADEAADEPPRPVASGGQRSKRRGGRQRGKGGGQRPGAKGGQRAGGKRPNKPSGAGDGRKRKPS